MAKLHLIEHPLIQHKISLMRDKNTGAKEFRELVSETAMLICYEATRDLPLKEVEIATPMAVAKTKVISGRKLAFVPVLRAGLGMIDGVINMVPAAKIGHIGMFRDNERDVIVVDPMLATGNTAVDAINEIKKAGVKNIKFMCIIASPQGIDRLEKAHPDVEIYCGAKDDGLDENNYIIPGLGDAGDRIFGTK